MIDVLRVARAGVRVRVRIDYIVIRRDERLEPDVGCSKYRVELAMISPQSSPTLSHVTVTLVVAVIRDMRGLLPNHHKPSAGANKTSKARRCAITGHHRRSIHATSQRTPRVNLWGVSRRTTKNYFDHRCLSFCLTCSQRLTTPSKSNSRKVSCSSFLASVAFTV